MSPWPTTSGRSQEVFGKAGILARELPGFEPRPGQLHLARAIDQAMREEQHILGEAPCGTGKSLAYGVPAAYHAAKRGKRVVIVTANIALQEQLVGKDLPMLARLLPWPMSFALLKGKSNYLCVDKLDALAIAAQQPAARQQPELVDIRRWANTTSTGDKSQLSFVPTSKNWSKVSSTAAECVRERCDFVNCCFAEAAKERAEAAQIVVTNYHMLFAHLEVLATTGKHAVLPSYDCLVLDEAHTAADIARDFRCIQVSEASFSAIAAGLRELGLNDLAENLASQAGHFFAQASAYQSSPAYRGRIEEPFFLDAEPLLGALEAAQTHSLQIAIDVSEAELNRSTHAARIASRLDSLRERFQRLIAQDDNNCVYWLEARGAGGVALSAKPVDVSGWLRQWLFRTTSSVTAVSATLAVGRDFSFARRELGVPYDARELVVDSPFAFDKQALLIVPADAPDPREPRFTDAVASALRRVMDLCGGRTLGLFTSHRVLDQVHAQLEASGHTILRQGDRPRGDLIATFKSDVDSVLLGTSSFWTGIDVKGEALTAVVIDKIPFPNLSDPVIQFINDRTPKAFDRYLLPKAIVTLRQGVGRLIRSRSDIGVVVLIDRRAMESRYSGQLMRALPRFLGSRDIDDIPRFLEFAKQAAQSSDMGSCQAA